MKKRVYIETTVVSYFTARASRDIIVAAHQETTMRLAAIADFPMLDIDEEARFLAERIIADRGIPAEYPEDALHIAVASVMSRDLFTPRIVGD